MRGKLVGMALGLLVVAAQGCSPPASIVVRNPMDPTQERLLDLVNAYWQYNISHRVPPRSATDIEPILRERGIADDVFRSPRDGEPFVVCWGTNVVRPAQGTAARPILAYEKNGRDGSRFVVLAERKVELLTEDEFLQASFPTGYGPAR